MDLLRLAFKHDPKGAANIMAKIYNEFVDKIKRGDGPNGSVSNPDKIISFKSL